MWPKMLLELLPHLSRLIPQWDKFLNSRAATDNAIAALSEQVKSDLGEIRGNVHEVTAAQTSLYRHLQDQNNQIAALAEEVRLTRRAAEHAEAAARLVDPAITIHSHSTRRLATLLTVAVVLLVVSILLQLAFHFAR